MFFSQSEQTLLSVWTVSEALTGWLDRVSGKVAAAWHTVRPPTDIQAAFSRSFLLFRTASPFNVSATTAHAHFQSLTSCKADQR